MKKIRGIKDIGNNKKGPKKIMVLLSKSFGVFQEYGPNLTAMKGGKLNTKELWTWLENKAKLYDDLTIVIVKKPNKTGVKL